jgi:hypothetical protein
MATTQDIRRKRASAVERALNERDGRERYDARQREIRAGSAEPRARPLEFDALGFPIPQPIPAFVQRVKRVINGG